MKLLLIVAILVSFGSGISQSAEPSGIPLHQEPRPLPNISFNDEAGTPLTLESWRGRVVLLNIWATWCGPCRAEMPTLDSLQGRFGGEHFEVVALSLDRAGVAAVRAFYDEVGLERLAVYIDQSGQAAQDLGVSGIPTSILIDGDGRELGRYVGATEWNTPEMIAFFEDLIGTQQEEN